MKKIITLFLLFAAMLEASAQPADQPLVDTLNTHNKLYTVVAVIVIIFCGLVFYLVKTNMRISRIEKKQGKNS